MNKEKEQCCFTVDHQGSGSFLEPNDFILYYIKYTFKLFQNGLNIQSNHIHCTFTKPSVSSHKRMMGSEWCWKQNISPVFTFVSPPTTDVAVQLNNSRGMLLCLYLWRHGIYSETTYARTLVCTLLSCVCPLFLIGRLVETPDAGAIWPL